MDRALQFFIFTRLITDQIGFYAVHLPLLKKGKIDCNKIMKIKPTFLTIAVVKKAHKKKTTTKNQKQKKQKKSVSATFNLC